MDLEKDPNIFERTDVWREGKWLDLWSVVHFLSGSLLGLGFYFLHFGAFASILLALVLLTAYEMWEMIVRIEEAPTNRFTDVVVGMASFLPTFLLLSPSLSWEMLVYVFALIFMLDIVMSFFGWRASQKAAELQKRMLIRYAVERARLLKQKSQLQERFRLDH